MKYNINFRVPVRAVSSIYCRCTLTPHLLHTAVRHVVEDSHSYSWRGRPQPPVASVVYTAQPPAAILLHNLYIQGQYNSNCFPHNFDFIYSRTCYDQPFLWAACVPRLAAHGRFYCAFVYTVPKGTHMTGKIIVNWERRFFFLINVPTIYNSSQRFIIHSHNL